MEKISNTFVLSMIHKHQPMIQPLIKNLAQSLTTVLRPALLLVGLMGCIQLNAQYWEYSYGADNLDQGFGIVQTKDHGFVIVGTSESFGSDQDKDVYVVRTDIDGDLIWEKEFDEGFTEFGYDIKAVGNGTLIIAGEIRETSDPDFDALLLLIEADGDKVWSTIVGDPDKREKVVSVIPASTGGFVAVGRQENADDEPYNVFLIRLDDNGSVLWEMAYGGILEEEGIDVVEVADGYVIAANVQEAFAPIKRDISLFKVDFAGNLVSGWGGTFGAPSTYEICEDMVLTDDGGFFLAGNREFNEVLNLKADANGNLDWFQTYDLGAASATAFGAIEVEDGYASAGNNDGLDGDTDFFIHKVAKNDGQTIWTDFYGRDDVGEFATCITNRFAGGLAVAGYTGESLGFFTNDIYLVKTDFEGQTYTSYIQGNVYNDLSGDCEFDPNEPGVEGWIVSAEGNNETFWTTTDENGNYVLLVDLGTYDVKLSLDNPYWEACELIVPDLEAIVPYDTLTNNDFGVFTKVDAQCPYLKVDVSTPFVTPCAATTYFVTYRNDGPVDATDVEVQIVLDKDLEYTGASILPASQVNDSLYIFEVADLTTGASGGFEIYVNTSCDAIDQQAFQVNAHITPDDLCIVDPSWNGASLRVNGHCDDDEVILTVKNIGPADMLTTAGYIVIEDNLMGRAELLLDSGDSMIIVKPANGTTYRIMAEQVEFHPGNSQPTISVEGCLEGGGTDYTTGFVTMFPEDESNAFEAVSVQEGISSTNNLSLRGYPKGYMPDTITNNTELKYHLYFENTTDDTVTRVVMRDTLDARFDLTTVEPGASSHAYEFLLYENGIVKFILDDLTLLPGEGGFVKFKVAQHTADIDCGTQVSNTALVNLGFEAPYLTNVIQHSICGDIIDDFVEIILDTNEPENEAAKVLIQPNPFVDQTMITIEGETFQKMEVLLFDANGRLILQKQENGNQLILDRGMLPSGVYFIQLKGDDQLIKTGKVIAQ
jgi:uncharacterized repeat protein (TIGR01451 family)